MKKDITDEIVDWLLQANYDLVFALADEDYETAAGIRDAIENFIQLQSEIIAKISKTTQEHAYETLSNNSQYMFNQITLNKENPNHL